MNFINYSKNEMNESQTMYYQHLHNLLIERRMNNKILRQQKKQIRKNLIEKQQSASASSSPMPTPSSTPNSASFLPMTPSPIVTPTAQSPHPQSPHLGGGQFQYSNHFVHSPINISSTPLPPQNYYQVGGGAGGTGGATLNSASPSPIPNYTNPIQPQQFYQTPPLPASLQQPGYPPHPQPGYHPHAPPSLPSSGHLQNPHPLPPPTPLMINLGPPARSSTPTPTIPINNIDNNILLSPTSSSSTVSSSPPPAPIQTSLQSSSPPTSHQQLTPPQQLSPQSQQSSSPPTSQPQSQPQPQPVQYNSVPKFRRENKFKILIPQTHSLPQVTKDSSPSSPTTPIGKKIQTIIGNKSRSNSLPPIPVLEVNEQSSPSFTADNIFPNLPKMMQFSNLPTSPSTKKILPWAMTTKLPSLYNISPPRLMSLDLAPINFK